MLSILKDAVDFFQANYLALMLITLIVDSHYILLTHLDLLAPAVSLTAFEKFLFYLEYLLLGNPVSTGTHAALYYLILTGSTDRFNGCFQAVKTHLPPLIIASFISVCLFFIAGVLFILPGFIVLAMMSFFPFFILYEKMPAVAALRKSVHLSREYIREMVIPVTLLIMSFSALRYYIALAVVSRSGIQVYVTMVGIDLLLTFFGSITLIIPFRVYCLHRSRSAPPP